MSATYRCPLPKGILVSQFERLARMRQKLAAGGCLGRQHLLDELEVSPATLKRDLAYLRDRLGMPVVFDRERGGWRLDHAQSGAGTQYELPGLWLSAEEIHALLTMQHLLAQIDAGGLLGHQLEPLAKRLSQLLGDGTARVADLSRRIRVQTVGARRVHLPHFQAVGSALLRRRRLHIDYHGRGRNVQSEREISPQRLVHYRDNWYLDAWCHLRTALRSFSVDAIRKVRVLDRNAVEVPDAQLDDTLGAGYGIFSGSEVQWATLRFTPERARWVAAETWHAKQRGRFEADGSYLLEVPYADTRELAMDVLRHVPEVEVVAPKELQAVVIEKLRAALDRLTL